MNDPNGWRSLKAPFMPEKEDMEGESKNHNNDATSRAPPSSNHTASPPPHVFASASQRRMVSNCRRRSR